MIDLEDPSSLHVSVADSVATMTLNNPRAKNAITREMAARIEAFCDRVDEDESIGAVVVDAAGSYFCSGADTRNLASASQNPATTASVQELSAVYRAFARVGSLPVPSVAVVRGGAVGAGLNLAMATDLMLVTPDAVLDSGFLARGIHPGGGHLALLGRSLGRQQALAMGAFGIAISGEEAVRRGLAWETAGPEEILGRAMDLASLPARDPMLVRRIMTSARLELGPPAVSWDAAVEIERGVQMWSLARKGAAGWAQSPEKPAVARGLL